MSTPAPVVVVRPPKPAHLRCTWSGVFGTISGPIEEWSFSLSLPVDATVDGFSDAQIDALAGGMRTAYVTNLTPRMPTDVILTECRIASVDGTGKVRLRPDGSYRQGINVVPSSGGDVIRAMPLQTALCVSLTTARPGPTGKGRFFLPWPSLGIDPASKVLTEAVATLMLDAAAGFVVDVNRITAGKVSVVSTKGYVSEVIGVRVGRVPDTMRSRRGDLVEGYVSRGLGPL